MNLGGGGIHTQARYNEFENIYTKNCGNHGIGIINTVNPGLYEFYLDGHTSIDDEGNSIDFSGYKDPLRKRYAFPEYGWKGSARNIISKNSRYGIKTAGHWDLDLENVVIDGSEHNGFFVNVDAPGKTINIKNMSISNVKGNGISIQNETNIIAEHVSIENCKLAATLDKGNFTFIDLNVSANEKGKYGIRVGPNAKLFSVDGFNVEGYSETEEYPLRLKAKNVSLVNGKLNNSGSLHQILIYDDVDIALIDNVTISEPVLKGKKSKSKGILILQHDGETKIVNSDFSQLSGRSITDKNKRVVTKNNNH